MPSVEGTVAGLLMLSFLSATSCSLYDPHPYPARGLFFEGWYTRLVDGSRSFGVIFGRILSAADESATQQLPANYMSIMRSRGDGALMDAADCTPDEYRVTIDGRTPVHEPDVSSPPRFAWNATGTSGRGTFVVDASSTVINIHCHNITFTAEIGAPVPWAAGGRGPAGLLDRLPLPLHWFVHSLGGQVVRYEWRDEGTGEAVRGTGHAHQEKNWGKSFPSSWFWYEGIDAASGRALAGSGAPLAGHASAQLLGYRNSARGISFDCTFISCLVSVTPDGCAGSLRLDAHHLLSGERLELNISTAVPSTLDSCLLGPSAEGFAPMCVESYVASASVRLWGRRHELLDHAEIMQADAPPEP